MVQIVFSSLVSENPVPLSSIPDSRGQLHKKLKAKVMLSFTADEVDEITIKEGDIVDVITMETEQDGWWLVCYGDQEGLAPSNYLSLIPPATISNIKGMVKKILLSILDCFKHEMSGFICSWFHFFITLIISLLHS